jgi:HK97 gp10 family phage protein
MADGVRLVLDRKAMAELLESEDGPVATELLRAAVSIEGTAKRLAPVDTGRLRASITHALERNSKGLVAIVGTDVSYARFVELGTRRTPPRSFLRAALAARTAR